jgi:hypothetical protein
MFDAPFVNFGSQLVGRLPTIKVETIVAIKENGLGFGSDGVRIQIATGISRQQSSFDNAIVAMLQIECEGVPSIGRPRIRRLLGDLLNIRQGHAYDLVYLFFLYSESIKRAPLRDFI